MFTEDPQAPNMPPKKDPLTQEAEQAQITGTRISGWALFFSIIGLGVTTVFAVLTYSLGIETKNNKDQLDSLNKIITDLATGNELMRDQNKKIAQQSGYISSEVKILSEQFAFIISQKEDLKNQFQKELINAAEKLKDMAMYCEALQRYNNPMMLKLATSDV